MGFSHPVASQENGEPAAELIDELTTNALFAGNFRSVQASNAGYTGDLLDLMGGNCGERRPGAYYPDH